ncbi:MAG: tetratricopeptide repeat protein [Rhodothermales bacterium]|nr:tetratricopeptide repeat protein [Rhodothermales bacterium]MBO6779049.1 tetratricopeptide repeat protein [Rhodothermales bacterium]
MTNPRHILLILVASLCVAATPVSVQAQDVAAQSRAETAIEQGRYDDAISILNGVIQPGTIDTRALLLRARAYRLMGNESASESDFRAVLEIDPANREALDGLQELRGQRSPATGNLGSLRRLVEANPDNLAFLIRYADALFDARYWQEAADQYGLYLNRTQGTPDIVQRYLIAIANYPGDNALGEAVADEYVAIYTTDDDLWMRLGYFRLWQGNYAGALEACEQSLLLNPANAESRDCQLQARNPDVIARSSTYPIDVAFRDVRANPDDRARRYQLIDLLIEAERYFEARQQLDILADANRGQAEWQRRDRVVEQGLRVSPGALSTFPIDVKTRALLQNPRQDDVRFELIDLLVADDRYFEAQQNLQYLRNEHGNSERWRTRWEDVSAELAKLDDGGRSRLSTYPIDVLTRDLMVNPNQDQKRFELVELLIENRRYFEADQNLAVLAPRHRRTNNWRRLNQRAEAGLRAAERRRPTPQQEFIVDRLYRELKATPGNDTKRFQLVDQLIKYDRYAEAYDQLVLLRDRHGEGRQWLSAFIKVDDGLVRAGTPIYAIDRWTYRLMFDPSDSAVRFQLVDALAEEGRVAEALEILTDSRYTDVGNPGYQSRLRRIADLRFAIAEQRVAELEDRLVANPNDSAALREIADHYLVLGRDEEAFETYAALLSIEPGNDAMRADFAEALQSRGYYDQALMQADYLLDRQPDNTEFQRLFVLASIAQGDLDQLGEAYVTNLMDGPGSNDPELLLVLAEYRLLRGDVEAADNYVRMADALGDTRFSTRISTVHQLVSRERIRLAEAGRLDMLNEARRLAAARQFNRAIDAYEDYFEQQGRRSRSELKELAQVHTAAADYVTALSILNALQEQAWEYDVAKEIGRNQIYREDYSGALRTLEDLANRNPRDFEVRFLMADAYRELGLFTQAEAVYADAQRLADASEVIEERSAALDVSMRQSLAQSGEWQGMDFAGIIVPVAEAVVARGGGTRYDRWAQGMQTHVTIPWGYGTVLMAGVNSHFIDGTRQLIPNSPTTRGRINQIFAAGYRDLTPPEVEYNHASYTNRVSGEVGIFDYEGGRTVGFGGIRYWRQDPGVYRGSVGLRTSEGAIELWSPAGGEYNLRLTQLNIRGHVPSVMPDSTLRLSGNVSFNVVRDNFGNTGNSSDTNFGTNILLEGSYKILGQTWLGLTYYQIDYRSRTDLYFSPRNYASYDLFLEYEKNVPFQSYLRLRGAMGIVSRSSGFVSRRIEMDWIRRLATNWSFNMSGSLGQSTRSLGSGATSFIDRYNTFTVSAALSWTL